MELLRKSATVEEVIAKVNEIITSMDPDPRPHPEIVDLTDTLLVHKTKKYNTREVSSIKRIVYHHVGDATGADVTPEQTARYHVKEKGWPGIAYHFMIAKDGTIWQTNRMMTVSYHCDGERKTSGEWVTGLCNQRSIGVCLIGSFVDGRVPTNAQLRSARSLNADLMKVLYLNPAAIIGHREVPGHKTTCPGSTFPQWKDKLIP